ncbi:hypothetical protein SteCoe_20913 [Stentor coeruleus]|uniref:Uncharacterized protein n=1 Tax=Stentor coeruleus TaxID=5963 RepID=A0A1R2BQN4_9CILI|nr:hypothetical protein SteCoe_20913 [Stentor coeruleus]
MDLNIYGHGLTITQIKTLDSKRKHYTKESLEALRHPYLETFPAFQDLLSHLTSFYNEKADPLIRTTKWKEVLHNSLNSLLSELIYTTDRRLQLKLLNDIFNWYYSKIKPTRSATPQIGKFNPTVTHSEHLNSEKLDPTYGSTSPSPMPIDAKRNTSTPQPINTKNLMKTTHQVFMNPKESEDLDMNNKLDSIFTSMRSRHQKRVRIGSYNESKIHLGKIQEWSDFKVKRLENLNHRHEMASVSMRHNTEESPLRSQNTTYDFSIKQREKESISFEVLEKRYKMYSRVGYLRNLKSELIDVEVIPAKKNYDIEFPKEPEPKIVYQISDIFDAKTRLAKRGLSTDIRDIKLGVDISEYRPSTVDTKRFPKGGETLLNNPLLSLKPGKKKKKRRPKKKVR